MIACARCNRPAPVDPDDLTCPGGDPSLLPVVVPPSTKWMPDPDGDGLICRGCATEEEQDEDDRRMGATARVIAAMAEEENGPADYGGP